MRIHLKMPFGAFTGYGRDGIGLSQALMKQGHQVSITPTSVHPPIPIDVAMLLTQYPEYPQDLTIHHVSPDMLGVTEEQLKRSYVTVAWSMWEFFGFGSEERIEKVTPRLESYPHVFAYDATSLEAFKTVRTGPTSILQGGYDPDFWVSEHARDWWSDELRLCMAGALGPRKDPYVAAYAVKQLREEGMNVSITMKCSSPYDLPPQFEQVFGDGVTAVREAWTDAEMKRLFEKSHAYISTSWGEGKNLPALEAGTTGCALLLSDVGGHRQWANSDFAILMQGKREAHEPNMESIRVSVETVKESITTLYEGRTAMREMGVQASRQLPSQMSWDSAAHRILAAVNAL